MRALLLKLRRLAQILATAIHPLVDPAHARPLYRADQLPLVYFDQHDPITAYGVAGIVAKGFAPALDVRVRARTLVPAPTQHRRLGLGGGGRSRLSVQ